jgi:hypothetical protein
MERRPPKSLVRFFDRLARVIRETHRAFIECGSMREEILPPWLAAIRARHRHSVSSMQRSASAARAAPLLARDLAGAEGNRDITWVSVHLARQ